jgi:hypothetical protein
LLPEPPAQDANGKTLPHDHEAITDDDILIRRISDKQIADFPNGVRKVSSMAFKPSSGINEGMSVDIERFIREDEKDPRDWVTNPRWCGSLQLRVQPIRQAGFLIGYDPIVPDNPYHGQIWGQGKGFNKAQQNTLRAHSTWFVEIPGVSINE